MTADEWIAEVQEALQQYFPAHHSHITVIRGTRVKVRVQLHGNRFLDLFFREETERIDYALVSDQRRIYGIDNLGGWHEHPLEAPASHQPCDEPSPAEAIRRLNDADTSLDDSAT